MQTVDVEIGGHRVEIRRRLLGSGATEGAGRGEEPVEFWDAVCADCGDDTGCFDARSELVRGSRGSYRSANEATSAATRHTADTRPL